MMPIHITAGAVGLISGFIAIFAAKGGALHRRSGRVFVYSMTVMAVLGAGIAAARGVEGSVIGGVITAYLVISGLITVRRGIATKRWVNLILMAVALTIGIASVTLALDTIASGKFARDGIPVPMLFIFGTVALLAGASDLMLARSGQLQGTRRIRRHLWRMCFALFNASGSFFLGQAETIPEPLRIPALLAFASFLPLILMAYWLWRVKRSRRPPSQFTDNPQQLVTN